MKGAPGWILLFVIAMILLVSGPTGSFGRVLASILTPSLLEVV